MNGIDSVKAEKARATRSYIRIGTFANLFRLVELCSALALLAWISSRIPLAVEISSEYLRKLIAVLISPLSIFLIGNGIVFTLLAMSGNVFGKSQANNADNNFYEELINSVPEDLVPETETEPEPEVIVFQDKLMVSEVNSASENCDTVAIVADLVSDSKALRLRRSQSENSKRETEKAPGNFLRRSETEKCPKVEESDGDVPAVSELSNEQFQRAIEEFIAKQVKFRKQDKLAIVATNSLKVKN